MRNELDAWFNVGGAGASAPAWKRNMLVLLVLYPVVFLTATWVQDPLLVGNGLPFWLALFVANIISVVALGWLLVPGADKLFGWWLYPSGRSRRMATLVGTVVVITLYGLSLALDALDLGVDLAVAGRGLGGQMGQHASRIVGPIGPGLAHDHEEDDRDGDQHRRKPDGRRHADEGGHDGRGQDAQTEVAEVARIHGSNATRAAVFRTPVDGHPVGSGRVSRSASRSRRFEQGPRVARP